MKKLLSTLGALSLVTGSALNVVACGGPKENEIIVQSNVEWVPVYQKAADAVNKEFSDKGLDFKVKIKTVGIFDEYQNIATKGVRDKTITDVFMLGFDRYFGYKKQQNIKDITPEIKKVFATDKDDQEKYGVKATENGIEATSSIWNTSIIKSNDGKEFVGMIPATVENNLWVFDKNQLGIGEDGKLVGDYVGSTDKDATIENLTTINKDSPKAVVKMTDGFFAGNFLNSVVQYNKASIQGKTDEQPSLLWTKKGKNADSENKDDFSSVFEDDDYLKDLKDVGKAMQEFAKSAGTEQMNQMKLDTGKYGEKITSDLKAGKTSMLLSAPYSLNSDIANMKLNAKGTPDIGVASVDSVTIAGKPVSSFAGGYGWAVKSTISDITKQDKDGNDVTKTEAAAMFIKEMSQAEYATEWALADGKYSPYKDNTDQTVKELKAMDGDVYKITAEAVESISKSYNETDSQGVTARPSTSLFDVYWGVFENNFKAWAGSQQTDFMDLFIKDFKAKKSEFQWG